MTLSALLELCLNNKWSCNNPFSCSRASCQIHFFSLTFKYWRDLLFSEVVNNVRNAFKSKQSPHFWALISQYRFFCGIRRSAVFHGCTIQKHSVCGHWTTIKRVLCPMLRCLVQFPSNLAESADEPDSSTTVQFWTYRLGPLSGWRIHIVNSLQCWYFRWNCGAVTGKWDEMSFTVFTV